jgi:uncharacterized cupin superfamily protein
VVVKMSNTSYAYTMEELQPQQQPPQVTQAVVQPHHKHGVVINLTVCLIVVAAALAGVYYWQHQKVSDLTSKNASLSSQLAAAQAQAQAAQSKTTTSSSSKSAMYKATVGKFTLTVPASKYAIIKQQDGTAGTGAAATTATSLRVSAVTSATNVFDVDPTAQVSVYAQSLGSQTFRNMVDTDLKTKASPVKGTVTVDGVSAESYKYGTGGASQAVYFTKNGVYYKVDANGAPAATLSAVLAGFKFD